jgi:hypothetical protein
MLTSCLAYYSTLNMEALSIFETSTDFQRTTWSYMLEDSFITTAVRANNPTKAEKRANSNLDPPAKIIGSVCHHIHTPNCHF